VTVQILRTITEGDASLVLRSREPGALELLLGNVVLLSSAALETERAFGRLAKEAFARTSPHASVVIGGLGFGATLRGCLEVAPPGARIVVAEKLRTVIDLARREAAHLVGDALDDPRVVVHHGDVGDVIREASSLSAILLDVDNGPEWASFRSNARLYGDAALAEAHRALAPGGIFSVWSGYPRDAFMQALRRARFAANVEPLRERGTVRARAYTGVVK
jgi:spermidine synthase